MKCAQYRIVIPTNQKENDYIGVGIVVTRHETPNQRWMQLKQTKHKRGTTARTRTPRGHRTRLLAAKEQTSKDKVWLCVTAFHPPG